MKFSIRNSSMTTFLFCFSGYYYFFITCWLLINIILFYKAIGCVVISLRMSNTLAMPLVVGKKNPTCNIFWRHTLTQLEKKNLQPIANMQKKWLSLRKALSFSGYVQEEAVVTSVSQCRCRDSYTKMEFVPKSSSNSIFILRWSISFLRLFRVRVRDCLSSRKYKCVPNMKGVPLLSDKSC